jgi:hypothetical protein
MDKTQPSAGKNDQGHESYSFPDENIVVKPDDEKIEIEVQDDTPEEDRNRKPMKEAPADVTEEELDQYSDSVKKRIQHFTKGYHEERRSKEAALREREEAIALAQSLVEENKRLQGSLGQGQAALIDQAKKVVSSEIEDAKRRYKAAYESGDADALLEAQEELTSAKIKLDRVNNFKPAPLQETKPVVQTQQSPVVDTRARAWQDENPWFGSDDEMTAVALTVHKKLVESKIDPTSDEYYEKINSRVRQLFPDAFTSEKQESEKPKKPTVVASATRSTAPRKIVLTQSQVNIAKRLGVPLEAYAKQVAADFRKNNG